MAYYDGIGWQAENLRQTLQGSERVLWEGRPARGPFIVRGWQRSCFGIIFLGFSLMWTMGALGATGPVPDDPDTFDYVLRYAFPLFGLPVILTGAMLTFSHYIVAALSWRNTEYAITNQRVLIRTGAVRPTVTSVSLQQLAGTRGPRWGVGTLSFVKTGPESPRSGPEHYDWFGLRDPSQIAFECIRDIATVQGIADNALQKCCGEK